MPVFTDLISQLNLGRTQGQKTHSLRHGIPRAPMFMCLFGLLVMSLGSPAKSLAQLTPLNSIKTIAGNGMYGNSGDGGPATSATLGVPLAVVTDSAGNIYISDNRGNVVRKIIASTGIITTVAGDGIEGFSGDGGQATSAELHYPQGLALDAAGNLYIVDSYNSRVRMVNASSGIITTIVGNGSPFSSGDGGLATNAGLESPSAIALDRAGNIFVADNGEKGIREINASTGIITTLISNASTPNPNFGALVDIAIDSSGNIYIGDPDRYVVFKYTAATASVSVLAGNGANGYSGDGGPATSAELSAVQGVALDLANNLYISDLSHHSIRRVSAATGIISTIVGTGTAGYTGDGGPAINAALYEPYSIWVDKTGNLYIPDTGNHVVREVSPLAFPATSVTSSSTPQNLLLQTTSAQTITSFTVPVSQGNKQEYTIGKITGCAVDGVTTNPVGTICTIPITFSPAYPGLRPVPLQAITSAGNINLGLNGLGVGPLAALTPGIITSIAGSGSSSYIGDGGPATSAGIYEPQGVALDNAGNIYFADLYHHVIRRIGAASGVITTVAGNGTEGFSGDGGSATSAELNYPEGISLDSAANLYIADSGNLRVRKVDAATGIITTVAGDGDKTDSGDGGLAVSAGFRAISDVKFDSHDNMYIADSLSIRRVDRLSGTISTIAGNGPGGDGVLAINSYVYPYSLAFDSLDNLYLVSPSQDNVRVITASDGYINTIAGNGVPGSKHSGDGGPATSAGLAQPDYVAVDSAGDLYISEAAGSYIRMVTASTKIISTIGGTGFNNVNLPGDGGPATAADIASPTGMALDGFGNVYIGSYVAERIRKINVSESALIYPTPTNVGIADAADDPQTAILTDIGNDNLKVPFASSPANPVISPAWALDSKASCSALSAAPQNLASGMACTLPVDFTPTVSGANNGTLVLADNSLNVPTSTQTISLTGTGVGQAAGPQPVLTPATINFGSLAVGTTSIAQTATLSNTGGVPQSISSFGFFGPNTSSFTQSNNCGPSLAAGASCSIVITCTPGVVGTLTANLGANFPSPEPQESIALSCIGTAVTAPQAVLTPASVSFGNMAVGSTSSAQTFTLTNSGNATLTITSVSLGGANASVFVVTSNMCGSSLAAGASCNISVTFNPTSVGTEAATLIVSDNAPGSPQSSSLTGVGVTPPASADFSITATPTSQFVTSGASAVYQLNFASINSPFTQQVALSASGLPTGATVTFSPASVIPGGTGAQSTMTIQTAVRRASSSGEPPWRPFAMPVLALALIVLPVRSCKRIFRSLACALMLIAVAGTAIGCGAGFALPELAPTTSTVVVTATSGTLQHSTSVQITVR